MKKMHPAGRPARNGKAGILSALFTAVLFACHAAGADFRKIYINSLIHILSVRIS